MHVLDVFVPALMRTLQPIVIVAVLCCVGVWALPTLSWAAIQGAGVLAMHATLLLFAFCGAVWDSELRDSLLRVFFNTMSAAWCLSHAWHVTLTNAVASVRGEFRACSSSAEGLTPAQEAAELAQLMPDTDEE